MINEYDKKHIFSLLVLVFSLATANLNKIIEPSKDLTKKQPTKSIF